jgi:hypothetical protein
LLEVEEEVALQVMVGRLEVEAQVDYYLDLLV